MAEFKVGDTVKRKAGNASFYMVGEEPFEVLSVNGMGYVVDRHRGQHNPRNLELVTAATPEPRPFQVGDVVRRTATSRMWGDFKPGDTFEVVKVSRLTVGSAGDFNHKIRNVELITPAPTTPKRKLGETPTGPLDDGDDPAHLPITDPRIAWIWADLATYADGKSWCSEYDELAAEVGIPGRVKKFSGAITIAGQRLTYMDIEAASQADAERIFRERVVAELQPAVPF